jgi:hypothetical protein
LAINAIATVIVGIARDTTDTYSSLRCSSEFPIDAAKHANASLANAKPTKGAVTKLGRRIVEASN